MDAAAGACSAAARITGGDATSASASAIGAGDFASGTGTAARAAAVFDEAIGVGGAATKDPTETGAVDDDASDARARPASFARSSRRVPSSDFDVDWTLSTSRGAVPRLKKNT